MTHDLESDVVVFAGDSHRWDVTLTLNGNAFDLSNATVSYRLFDEPYQSDTADAVLDDSDSGVTVIDTSPIVDPSNGEFQVRVDEGETADLMGEYWSRFVVDPDDATKQQWRQKLIAES